MPTGQIELRMSLPDIARLTGVQRPVVSMWRTRSAGSELPFPAPVAADDGQDWFSAPDVVGWLESTGRGQDGQVRANAAAFSSGPADPLPPGDETGFLGVTALLCLTEVSGRRLATIGAADLVDLADECDPDDGLLFSEIEALGDRLTQLAGHADALADAAFSPAGAFETVLARAARLRLRGFTETVLSTTAHDLMAATAVALAERDDTATLRFVDPTGGSDLLVATAGAAEGRDVEMRCAADDDRVERLARRRLRVHRVPRIRTGGATEFPPGAVVLGLLPTAARPAMSDAEVLATVNDLAMDTTAHQRVLVLAPASALIDRLTDPAARLLRDDLLRTDRLRALVRLPAGLVSGRPRQRLALCCLGPDFAGLPAEQRRTTVADLDGVSLDRVAIDALATDLVAAMNPDFGTRAHRPAYLRPVPIRALRAGSGSLIPATPVLRPAASGLDRGATVVAAAEQAGRAVPPMAPPAVAPVSTDAMALAQVLTLGAAQTRGVVSVLPGVRDVALDALPAGGLAVFDPDALANPAAARRQVDRLIFERSYPHARHTEPGDVVFIAGSRPRAVVDDEGGAVVPMPARVLRIRPGGGLLPHVLAAEINAFADDPGPWRSWPVRLVPVNNAAALERYLTTVQARRVELVAALEVLSRVEALLIDQVAAGTLTLEPSASPESPPNIMKSSTPRRRTARKDRS